MICIKEVTLLDTEEYKRSADKILPIEGWWWLRSPGPYNDKAMCVGQNGSTPYSIKSMTVDIDDIGVRPAMRFDARSAELKTGDKLDFGGYQWTVIDSGLALCDESVCEMPFCKNYKKADANVYETSDIKTHLEWEFAHDIQENSLAVSGTEKNGQIETVKLFYRETRIAVIDITLLSTEEYYRAEAYIAKIDRTWWLRSPGNGKQFIAGVTPDGIVSHGGFDRRALLAVRPAIHFTADPALFPVREKFMFAGVWWTVISDGLALCDGWLYLTAFRQDAETEDANIYERSNVRSSLDRWLTDAKTERTK